MNAPQNGYVFRDDKNVPYITGTTTKVLEVVRDHFGLGWSPEEIHEHYPYLTLAQIYAALAYYFDHRDEIDQDIARRDQFVEESRAKFENTELAERLRKLKRERSRS